MPSPAYHATDFLVIGGGVIGLSTALELRRRHPDCSITVIEKEPACGAHASGRNSGVLHAGFYYTDDSLKSQLTRDGNRRLSAWCDEHEVPLRRCGKLVVAKSERQHGQLDELLRRARVAGVQLEPISEAEARRIEPRVRTAGRALFSPTTSSVDPKVVMATLARQVQEQGVELWTSTAWTGRQKDRVSTSRGPIAAGYVVNAAGLQADQVAHAFGFGERYRMLPMKGLYLMGNAAAGELRSQVYPVPDLGMPFLGVHLTVTVDGHLKIGPTAVPAFWLENYGALGSRELLSRFSLRELVHTLSWDARLLLSDRGFRNLALQELKKMLRSELVRAASELVDGVRLEHFDRWGPAGIRAQLLDVKKRQLVMDFCYEGDDRSMHILNAVSPAFTCALSFAEHIADAVARATG